MTKALIICSLFLLLSSCGELGEDDCSCDSDMNNAVDQYGYPTRKDVYYSSYGTVEYWQYGDDSIEFKYNTGDSCCEVVYDIKR